MAKLPVLRSPQANRDLKGIWSYIAKDNAAAASSTLRRIDRKIELLATHPEMGELQSEFGPDLRRIVIGNYLVFYEVTDDAVQVLRVFHAAQQWEELL